MFERHLQSFLLGLLSLLVVWFGQSTIQTREDVIQLRGEVRALEARVGEKMRDQYTGTEAASVKELMALEHRYFENTINENSARISKLELRINSNN